MTPVKPVRTSRGWLTRNSLAKGYVEQRAWLSVDMSRHTVELRQSRLEPQELIVYYTIAAADGGLELHEQRFHHEELEAARKAFSKAGAIR